MALIANKDCKDVFDYSFEHISNADLEKIDSNFYRVLHFNLFCPDAIESALIKKWCCKIKNHKRNATVPKKYYY